MASTTSLYWSSSKFLNKKFKIGTIFKSGRNFSGHICVHHKNSGIKKTYSYIDFFRRINSFGLLYKIIKDQNRTAFLGAIFYENGLFSYIILSENLKIGDKIYSGSFFNINKMLITTGYAIPLSYINLFNIINNIESFPYKGSIFSRSAGSSAVLIGKKKIK